MDPLNILYTPLDTSPIPNFDSDKLMNWINNNQKQILPLRRDASLVTPYNLYPWNISYPMIDKNWMGNFNIEFTELANYFYTAFDLQESDLNSIVLLPTKSDFVGEGFWHADPDETGLRMYLENTETDKDFLLIKGSKLPYDTQDRSKDVPNNGEDDRFHTTRYSAKVHTSKQVFFLNNVRGIHSVNVTNSGSFRIAVIVTLNKKFSEMPNHLKELIVNSAQKFSDLAIIRPE